MTDEQKLQLLRCRLENAQNERAYFDVLCKEFLEDILALRKEMKE